MGPADGPECQFRAWAWKAVEHDDEPRKTQAPSADGTTHLLLSPHERLEKHAALVPPRAGHRSRIVPGPTSDGDESEDCSGHACTGDRPAGRHRLSWAKLLARVVHVDHGVCPTCGGAGGPDGTGVYPSLSQRDGAELARPADRAAGRVRSSRLIHPGATLVDFGIVNNVWECTDWLIVGRKTGHKLWWKDIA